MRYLLSAWPSTFKKVGVPPLELLLPFLEAPAPTSGHVSWNGIDPARPEADFNKQHEATYRWSTGHYPVVRVLFWHRRGVQSPRTSLVNDCGVVACCNIDHWHVVTSEERGASRRAVVYTAFDSPEFRRKK